MLVICMRKRSVSCFKQFAAFRNVCEDPTVPVD
jgi:hypothetical protein